MKNYLKIFLFVIAFITIAYFIYREAFWVVRDYSKLDENLEVHLEFYPDLIAWQDPVTEKNITIKNIKSGSILELNFESIKWDLYFFIDTNSTKKVLTISDIFRGQNEYDYQTLKLSPNQQDCFQGENYCGGFSNPAFYELGKPSLIYENEGFKK